MAAADRVEIITPYIIRAWIRTDESESKLSSAGGGSMARYELLCKTKQYKTLAFTSYKRDGTTDYIKPREDIAYTNVTPETVMETVLELVCATFGKTD